MVLMKRNNSKKQLAPMRFSSKLPDSFDQIAQTPARMFRADARNTGSVTEEDAEFDKGQYYMQLSDSDDDDKPDRSLVRVTTAPNASSSKKQNNNNKTNICFSINH